MDRIREPRADCTLCQGTLRVRGLDERLNPTIDPCIMCCPDRCPPIDEVRPEQRARGVGEFVRRLFGGGR